MSNPVDAKPNKELFGAWKIDLPDKGPKDYGIVVVGNADLRGAPASVLKFVSLSSNNEDKINIGGSYFFTTSLATENYANILNQSFMEKDSPQTWDKARVGNWNLLKYSVDKDRLTIWFMNNKALEEAIGNKELKGIVEEKSAMSE
ncbi:MAG TPA: hypothetical protein VGX70_04460 [Gemmataceae bacterium]|nr:hypothetical protein [Gemmataceae bacterium]